ncbi:ribosomal protein S18-alanine N-acetyltransferase [Zophobihabitans entericus]|uniref:[Ribosomal protein bS18]-alanine N-acetyltransferase n=1 Tax=Zophobihabitans entericus TaxID=1635327 RepID=A0A6G9ICJ3_9GAMM|nr:ribosomal protein S18-alanine N-acetyltransferase [Zophobihabitans entericus]QIQ21943.1 ribosomal protein S18-alanine N-acetyltransferase [Zophobihabitans entericus]
MNTISILNKADLPAAFKIGQAAHAFPWSWQNFESNQGERYLNLKIERDGQIVGFLITQVVLDEANLFNIAIDPAFQKQGLATELLNHLIEELAARNVVTLWLEVRASNTAAINLYNQLGFNEITIRTNYYPAKNNQREDAIIMAYTLSF